MKVSILYFDGCPNHPPVMQMAQRVVAEHHPNVEVEEIEVAADDVVRHRFLGSPTIQVDGTDIEPSARERTDFAMSCRVYDTVVGRPPEEMLLAALDTFASTVSAPAVDRAGVVAVSGSVVTAILSSACCWLPLLLLASGASAAGASAFLEQWRPAFMVVAVTMLGFGFYVSYFRNTAYTEGCCVTRSRRAWRIQRSMLWVSAVVVAASISFPSYVGVLFGSADSSAVADTAGVLEGNTRDHVFDIEGMHCEGCAVTLRLALAELDGVIEAEVDYGTRRVRVRAAGNAVAQRVGDAAARVGYTATMRSKE